MPRPGPEYSPEFRADAVWLMRSSGRTVAELSRELGVSQQTLRRWRLQAGDDPADGSPAPPPRSVGPRGKDADMRKLARLTAEVIEAGVAVVTLPAKWTANGLRWYADRRDDPSGKNPEG